MIATRQSQLAQYILRIHHLKFFLTLLLSKGHVYAMCCAHVEVREQLLGVGFLSSTVGSRG